MTERFLEDFSVGQTFGGSGRTRIDAARIKSFAAEFDPQPFHLDEKAADGSIFKGLAASGWHTAALTMRLLVESDIKPSGGIVGAGFDEFRWPRPVRPGDELRVEAAAVEVGLEQLGVLLVVVGNQNARHNHLERGRLIICRSPRSAVPGLQLPCGTARGPRSPSRRGPCRSRRSAPCRATAPRSAAAVRRAARAARRVPGGTGRTPAARRRSRRARTAAGRTRQSPHRTAASTARSRRSAPVAWSGTARRRGRGRATARGGTRPR